jgi:hypothetical protein
MSIELQLCAVRILSRRLCRLRNEGGDLAAFLADLRAQSWPGGAEDAGTREFWEKILERLENASRGEA